MKNLRVIFMGTPDFAVPVLEELIKNTNVVGVVTQPDKLVGRKQILTKTPIKKIALEHNIKVFQPTKIKEDYQEILNTNPDIIITCAYGQIIPKSMLDFPKYGCINVHASLLPKLRGGAPIHHAIIDGLKETGITIMYMDELMDTGDIIATASYQIKDTDNVGILHDILSSMGSHLLIETLPSIINGTNKREKQNNAEATYAWNIKREEEHLDFTKSGILLDRQVRGLNPWPLANTVIDNKEYKIINGYFKPGPSTPNKIISIDNEKIGIGCLDGIFYITRLKPFGKKEMAVKDFVNGINKEEFIKKEIS